MTNGYLELFVWRGIPVRVHWSTFVLAAYSVGEGRRSPGLWLGVWTFILLHEAGHAILCQAFRLRVLELRLLPFGGECVHEATPSMRQSVVIAWGGVLAQLVLFLAVVVLSGFQPFALSPNSFIGAFVTPNLLNVAFNLLPVRPLDGYTAWRLKYLLRDDRPPTKPARPARPASVKRRRAVSNTERAQLDELVDNALLEARRTSVEEDSE